MVFDDIYLNSANYDEIAELLKVIEHVHDMLKNHISSIQIIQILTKRSVKRQRYFIVKVHLSNMNLLLHISSLRTLWVLHNKQTKTKKEALCTLNIISCRIPLTNKLNLDLQIWFNENFIQGVICITTNERSIWKTISDLIYYL